MQTCGHKAEWFVLFGSCPRAKGWAEAQLRHLQSFSDLLLPLLDALPRHHVFCLCWELWSTELMSLSSNNTAERLWHSPHKKKANKQDVRLGWAFLLTLDAMV